MAGPASDDPLVPYRGPFGPSEAAFLLNRSGFGATLEQVEAAAAAGLEPTIERLFAEPPADEASAWRDLVALGPAMARRGDIDALRAEWLQRFLRAPQPWRENLTLFWHDHFATSYAKVADAGAIYEQNRLFLELGAGPFPELLDAVAKDAAMIRWLDNDTNVKGRPNENFARELLELFTLGIGAYDERDIREAARAFTGWHVRDGRFAFRADDHDDGVKTVFGATGEFGGEDVLRACVARAECPRFIAGKLWRWFADPDHDGALDVRLGRALEDDGLAIGKFLRRVFASRAFYVPELRRRLVKSPVAFTIGALRRLGARADARALAEVVAGMGQELYAPPSVNGWEHGRAWINSATLIARCAFAELVAAGPRGPLKCSLGVPDDMPPERIARALLGDPPPAGWLDRLLAGAATRPESVAAAIIATPEFQID